MQWLQWNLRMEYVFLRKDRMYNLMYYFLNFLKGGNIYGALEIQTAVQATLDRAYIHSQPRNTQIPVKECLTL